MWHEIGYSILGGGLFLITSYEFGAYSARYTLKKSIKALEEDKEYFEDEIDKHNKLLDEINKHFIFT